MAKSVVAGSEPINFNDIPIVKDQLPSFEEGPKTKQLRELLYRRMRIELNDGRMLTGIFSCFDKDSNVMLADCTEMRNVRPVPAPENQTEKEQKDVPLQKFYTQRAKGEEIRQLGLVLVPGAHIKQCCIDEHPAVEEPTEEPGTKADGDAQKEETDAEAKTEAKDTTTKDDDA